MSRALSDRDTREEIEKGDAKMEPAAPLLKRHCLAPRKQLLATEATQKRGNCFPEQTAAKMMFTCNGAVHAAHDDIRREK
jgi:hypothetical protein